MKNLKYYTEGDALYADMVTAINAATQSINIESYIFANDAVGEEFIQLLYKKIAQEVTVRIIIDSVGSRRFENFKHFRKLSKRGVLVKWFNPWSWRDPLKFNRRNHRKLMLIDDELCFIGGFNIHDKSSKKYYGENRWKDSHISFHGDLAKQLSAQFDLIWCGKIRQLSTVNSLDSLTHIVPNANRKCRNHLRCKYLATISQARKSIKVTTPYFVPDSQMLKALVQAAKSGISITLLIPKYNDHALLKYAAYWYYQKLILSGINIYEFTSRMLHAKTMIVDDDTAVIGSANMDYRSFFLNNEIMLFSKRRELVEHINQDFTESLEQSCIVSLKEATTRSPLSLFSTFIAYLLRRWL